MTRKKNVKIEENNDCLIRTIREALGITIDELAALSNLRYDTVYRAENTKAIRQDAVEKIATALNVSPDIISYSTGQIPPEKIELIKKDPLFFKGLLDSISAEPEKLTKTQDYIQSINTKMKNVDYADTIKIKMKNLRPDVNKLLSKVKPS